MENVNVKTWKEQFINGDFENNDVKTQIKAGWYDWFCKNSSLANKTKKMGDIIKQVKDGGKVDLDNWYVWFKNNCPLNGPLYDDFRFANLETGDVQFTIQINNYWNNYKFAVYGRTPDGEGHWNEPLFKSDSLRDLVKWLNTPWDK